MKEFLNSIAEFCSNLWPFGNNNFAENNSNSASNNRPPKQLSPIQEASREGSSSIVSNNSFSIFEPEKSSFEPFSSYASSNSNSSSKTPIDDLQSSNFSQYSLYNDKKNLKTCSTAEKFYTNDFTLKNSIPSNALIVLEVKGLENDYTYYLNQEKVNLQQPIVKVFIDAIPNIPIQFNANIAGRKTRWDLNPSSPGMTRS